MDRIRKQMLFPKDLVNRVKVYQHKNMLDSFTATVIHLLEKALSDTEKEHKDNGSVKQP